MAKLLCPKCKNDSFEIFGWEGWRDEFNFKVSKTFDECKTRSYLIKCKKCEWKTVISI